MKLYEITNDVQNIFNNIGEDGELTQDMLDNLDSLQQDFENKAVSVAAYIKNIEAEETAIAEAIKEMSVRKQRLAKQAQGLSDYLQYNLEKLSISEIKTSPYFKIRLKKCPPSVDVIEESEIPEDYFNEKVVKSLDKIKVKEDLHLGVDIPGVTLKYNIKLEIK